MKWKDEDILEWNKSTFPHDPIKQLNKVEEELLELEQAKRQIFMTNQSSYHHVYEETADVIIACIGLKRYTEYAAISRAIYNYINTPFYNTIRPWIDNKMDENVKRTFDKETWHHKES